MPLPIKIEELFKRIVVESDRLEYKEGLNPEKVAQTICAFANDINNIGGGYIILGVESKDGAPKLSPKGLEKSQIEAIQKNIIEVEHKIMPFPQVIVSPEIYKGKNILVLWVPGGDSRPYKAPISYSGKEKAYYIRRHSSTVRANGAEEKRLLEISTRIPFDDRINHGTEIEDMSKDTIMQFLKDAGSSLYKDAKSMSLIELCQMLQICRGPKENIKPVNVGLLMFSDEPEKYFPGARIEIAEFEDEIGRKFSEKVFKGPIHRQLKAALEYVKNMVLKEKVRKIAGRAEAERFFNYPYQAIEEALANAVYHRGYELRDPIEVNIFPDRMEIISKPGPMPPISNNDLKKARVPVREYRNRRIGDFLKELELTEAKGTGFPEIRESLRQNGSPIPEFKTDKNRMYFLVTLKAHRSFLQPVEGRVQDVSQVSPKSVPSLSQVGTKSALSQHQVGTKSGLSWDQVGTKSGLSRDEAVKILTFCETEKAATDIMALFDRQNKTKFKNKYIKPLLKLELLNMTIPKKPNSSKQRYVTTEKGMNAIK